MRQIHFQHISRGWTQTSEYLPIPLKDPIYSSPATSVRSPNCYLLINKNLQDHSSPDMSNIWNTSVDQTGKQDIWSDTYPVSDTKKKKHWKHPSQNICQNDNTCTDARIWWFCIMSGFVRHRISRILNRVCPRSQKGSHVFFSSSTEGICMVTQSCMRSPWQLASVN